MERRRATIAALASGRPPGAIAIVRVSGPHAFDVVRALVGTLPPSRRASVRAIRRSDGLSIDRALVLIFPAPASATGEDVAELHVHGGMAVVAATLAELTAHPDVRLALPGEFTRRAFDNGCLDLTQVEGLADLLAATTEAQRAQASAQMDGALARRIADWQGRLLDALAQIEARIDFADEGDIGEEIDPALDDGIDRIAREMRTALAGAGRGERLRDGLTVVLAGAPNVGKSSLLNALAGREAAIVSPEAGTTRDAVEVTLDLGGVPVTLVDTAGLRDSLDPVEAHGIARARSRAATADLVLALADGEVWATQGARVRTKIDLAGLAGGEHDGAFHVSARTGAGLDALIAWLTSWAAEATGSGEVAIVTRVRQREALAAASVRLDEVRHSGDPALRAESLRLALRALQRLAGAIDVEDVLDRIFGSFCIGK